MDPSLHVCRNNSSSFVDGVRPDESDDDVERCGWFCAQAGRASLSLYTQGSWSLPRAMQ